METEKAPYTSFVQDATLAPPAEKYDYIIIGGGTAGCPLAATLSSSSSLKVLLLERGGLPYNNPNINSVSGFLYSLADTSPTSPSQLFVSTDGVFNHRGRVLGGSSAINAGFFTRASDEEVSQAGWEPRLVNESYEWVESKVAFQPRLMSWQSAFRNGLLEAGLLPYRGFTYDHLHGTKIGGSTFDQNGNRHTAADLLEYANPNNIFVYLHATVYQILFKNGKIRPKAYGVFYRDSNGGRHMAYLNNDTTSEIILSAGAIGSPQMLMLSGIGPAEELKAHGIEVVLDQPNVGQGMSDNPMNSIVVPSRRPVEVSLVQVVGISDVGSYIEAASWHFQHPWASGVAEEYAKLVNQSLQTVKLNFAIQPTNHTLIPGMQGGLILEKIMGPFSKGYLELESKNPNDNPRVTFNYFKDPRDLQRCVQGMDLIRRVVESGSLSSFRYPFTSFESLMNIMLISPINLRTKHFNSNSMEQFCIDTVTTIWHYHGGCHVDSVVDHDLRVIGVDSLRVVDGSTFSNSPGTNPQATLMMLGRYMGLKILQERIPK